MYTNKVKCVVVELDDGRQLRFDKAQLWSHSTWVMIVAPIEKKK